MKVINATEDHAQSIADIYNYHILNTLVTFETAELSASDIFGRIQTIQNSLQLPYIVCVTDEGDVMGYAYATLFRDRAAYKYSLEESVYVSNDHHRKGVGTVLLNEIIKRCRDLGVKSLMAITGLEPDTHNFHLKMGFEQVGIMKDIGWKMGGWVSRSLYQLMLNNDSGTKGNGFNPKHLAPATARGAYFLKAAKRLR
eukprot:TRINITY_DN4591_c0_g1_i1.p1 TRINITY_DN4591_c0_g1~~TRINITY_DN4591_c0_g1_i1.p1  ORF type:complete len:198 (-),score=15.36 TRINITY_DN4591_c0_g1_i1:71-664(-)